MMVYFYDKLGNLYYTKKHAVMHLSHVNLTDYEYQVVCFPAKAIGRNVQRTLSTGNARLNRLANCYVVQIKSCRPFL
jgi:hypothetical protein